MVVFEFPFFLFFFLIVSKQERNELRAEIQGGNVVSRTEKKERKKRRIN